MALQEGALFGMGNPLLDIIATVDEQFLEKYKMKANDAILAEDHHIPMYEDLKKNFQPVEYVAGGATQNVLRTVQWIIGQPNVSTFMGGVGNDENGQTLANAATAAGVNVQYQIVGEHPTGTCAVLITGTNRSLCAYLAAANHFTKCHLDKPDNRAYIEKAKFYYISGFFLTVSPESLQTVAQHASSQNKPFMFNLSAPFICQFFTDRVLAALPYVDILFANESEARAFATSQNYGTEDVAEIALKVVNFEKHNKERPRIVVFTQGCDPVIVAQGTTVKQYPVCKLPSEIIKDTNGAGDAFVGGFLAEYIRGKPMDACVACGIWTAGEVIQQLGCTFPKDKTYKSCQ